jgi:adenylate kinase
MNIALIGPSGVGKGTHVAELVREFGFVHVSTGDLFRANLTDHSALGLLARKYMDRGELVPDEIVDAMIEERVRKAAPEQGLLFDGFPRTAYQGQFLDELFASLGRRLEAVFYLRVSDEEITRRLSGRLICRNCQTPFHTTVRPPAQPNRCDVCGNTLYQRPDDTPALVAARLRTFHRATGPLLDYYQASGRCIILSGEGPIDQVRQAVLAAVAAVQRHQALGATRAELEQVRAREAPVSVAPPEAVRPSLDLVLLGGPGSGKGTQAEQLCKRLDLPHVATGDLFRDNLRRQTELGQLAKTYMDRGELVPDDVTEAMVEQRLAQPDTVPGFILDGFPRTLPQAEALAEMLAGLRRRLARVLYINVPDEAIVERLSARMICRQCQAPYHLRFKPPATPGRCDACGGELYQRDDDNPATVRARLKTFHGQTEPLIEFYRQAGLLTEVDGAGGVAAVQSSLLAAVGVPA